MTLDLGLSRETFFASLGIAVAFVRYVAYFYAMYKREARPHVFSWFNWALIVGIAAVVQYQAGGGASVWVLACVSVMCAVVSVFALFIGEKNITRGDWITFIAALAAIPVWLATRSPLLTFFILLFIDLCSYYPTWRKMYHDPWSEPVSGFALSGLRYFFALLAVPEPSFMTLLYPFWLMAADWGGGVYGYIRRVQLRRTLVAKI